jgi:predicted permease
MNLFLTTFESVIVLLGIGLLGFWIIQKKLIPGNIIGLLSPLALDIALPSFIFVNIIQNFNPGELSDWWTLPLYWLLFVAITGCLTFLSAFISKKEIRSEFAASLFFQNGIFFPLAIISGMFGEDSNYLVYLFLFTLFYPAFFFSTCQFFFGKKKIQVPWKKIFHPVLFATLLAISIRLGDLQGHIPDFFMEILRLLGGMTIPIIMIILGGNIYVDFQKKGKIYAQEIIKFVILKNILFPLVFLLLIILTKPPYPIALILILQSAVPPVTAIPLLTERAGGNRAIVNQFIVSSFITSLLTIPLMISLFSTFFTPP